jgi:hypothetical protein
MACRLHITAEGQTELGYVNRVLVPHLGNDHQVVADARAVKTGRKRGKDYRGGLLVYETAKLDIQTWMKEEAKNHDVWFTTMFDLYALPSDFPGQADARLQTDPYEKVRMLEDALKEDLGHPLFIPYVQLHEFEALMLADPQKLDSEYLEHDAAISKLVASVDGKNPEEINEGRDSAPSKRIIAEIPEYERQKATVGPVVVEKIGLATIRQKCRHFREWIDKLESLGKEGK